MLWTSEEKNILINNYGQIEREELLQILPNRTWQAICRKAQYLGIKFSSEKHCKVCNKIFIGSNHSQIYCKECKDFIYAKQQKRAAKEWYLRNKNLTIDRAKKWIYNNYEECLKRHRNWNKNNRKYYSEYIKNRRKDINNKMIYWSRYQIFRCLNGNSKKMTTFKILGYTKDELMKHLENIFTPEMNWDNYGKFWQIDHIRPLSSFNFKTKSGGIDYKMIKVANSLENLQPLTVKENLIKSNKWTEEPTV